MEDKKSRTYSLYLMLKKNSYNHAVEYKGKSYLTKKQILYFFDISKNELDKIIETHQNELVKTGYKILEGNELEKFLKKLDQDINEQTNSNSLEVFTIETILNLSMLIPKSKNAVKIRENMSNIVMEDLFQLNATFKQKTGTNIDSEEYEELLEQENIKHLVFQSIFKEKAVKYKNILLIKYQDNIRISMNEDIKKLINKYSNLIIVDIRVLNKKNEKSFTENDIKEYIQNSHKDKKYQAIIDEIELKIKNRNLIFMEEFYKKLKDFPDSVDDSDIEKYIQNKCNEVKEKFLEHDNFEILTNLQGE